MRKSVVHLEYNYSPVCNGGTTKDTVTDLWALVTCKKCLKLRE